MGKSVKNILLSEFSFVLTFWLCFGLAIIILQYESASIELRITAKANRDGNAQIFWAKDQQNFSEENSKLLYVGPAQHELSFPISFRGEIDRFRLDPLKDKGTLEISSAVIYQPFRHPVDIFPVLQSKDFVPLQQGSIEYNGNIIVLKASDDDPAFTFPHHVTAITAPGSILVIAGCIFIALLTQFLLNQKLLKGKKCAGTLSITLLKDQPLTLPPQLKDTKGILSPSGKENHRRYLFHLDSVDNQFILQLLSDIHLALPDAVAVFHYNRAGEV